MTNNMARAARRAAAQLVDVMEAAEHRTAWLAGDVQQGEERGRCFLLLTVDTDRARRIEDVLQAAGLLCDEKIGHVSASSEGGE